VKKIGFHTVKLKLGPYKWIDREVYDWEGGRRDGIHLLFNHGSILHFAKSLISINN